MLTAINSHLGCVVAIKPEPEMLAFMQLREPERAKLASYTRLRHHWVRAARTEDYPVLEAYQAREGKPNGE